jgi:hypothetical protein
VGLDASEFMRALDGQRVMRELDAQRVLLGSAHIVFANDVLRQYKQLARDLRGVEDELQRSIQGIIRLPESVRRDLLELHTNFAVPESVLRDLLRLRRNLADLGYSALTSSIAHAFESHGFASANIAAWSLRPAQSLHTSALRSVLKAATTFGPIVVSPDYEDDAPFNYHPDLGRLLPDTATNSGGATEVEELWAEVIAFAQGIANHHRTKVFLSVMTNGTRFVIRVSKHPIVAGTVAGTVGSAAGGIVTGDIVTGAVSGGVSALLTYLLTRR